MAAVCVAYAITGNQNVSVSTTNAEHDADPTSGTAAIPPEAPPEAKKENTENGTDK
jgi:hypothetical protein